METLHRRHTIQPAFHAIKVKAMKLSALDFLVKSKEKKQLKVHFNSFRYKIYSLSSYYSEKALEIHGVMTMTRNLQKLVTKYSVSLAFQSL